MGSFVEVDNVSFMSGQTVSEWVRLHHRKQAVAIASENWNGAVARLEYSVNGRDVVRGLHFADSEIACHRNRVEQFDCPGFLRIACDNKPDADIRLLVYADPDTKLVAEHTLEEALLLTPGVSDWLPLTNLNDTVCVTCSDWAGNVAVLESSFDGRFVFPMGQHNEDLVCRKNTSRVIEVGGMVRINATSVVSPIRLTVASFNVTAQTRAEQLTTNSLMIDYFQRNPDAKDFTVRQWKDAIGRSIGSIQATKTWASLMSVRDAAKIDRLSVQSPND